MFFGSGAAEIPTKNWIALHSAYRISSLCVLLLFRYAFASKMDSRFLESVPSMETLNDWRRKQIRIACVLPKIKLSAKLSVFLAEGAWRGKFALRGVWTEDVVKHGSKVAELKSPDREKLLQNGIAGNALQRGKSS